MPDEKITANDSDQSQQKRKRGLPRKSKVEPVVETKEIEQTSELQETEKSKLGDEFSIDRLYLSQNFDEIVGVKKQLTTVPIRKPSRQEWFMVREGDEFFIDTALLELREDINETYLVAPSLWQDLYDDLTYKRLYVYINRRDIIGLWPIKLPDADGRLDHYNRSALDAAERGKKWWTKIQANRNLAAYEVFMASEDLPPPKWPQYTLQQLLDVAFCDYKITSLDHIAIQRLHGKV